MAATAAAPLMNLAAALAMLGLPNGDHTRLFLRFERMGRLRLEHGTVPDTVGVLATWRPESLASGCVDAVTAVGQEEAALLLRACRAIALPVVNNLLG